MRLTLAKIWQPQKIKRIVSHDDTTAPHLKVDQIRELVKRLRRLRANLFLEILDEKECRSVIEDEAGRVPATA